MKSKEKWKKKVQEEVLVKEKEECVYGNEAYESYKSVMVEVKMK